MNSAAVASARYSLWREIAIASSRETNGDVLVLFTYLYAPTVMAARIAPGKTVLVPTAHDEPAIRLDIFRELFTRVGAIAWNTESERRFANSLFDLRPIAEDVIGCGVELPEGEAVAEGVETAEQLSFLASEGCDAVQGYLLGKPAPIGQYAALVGRNADKSMEHARKTG